MNDERILNRLQQEILAIQTNKPIYVGRDIIGEDGSEVKLDKPLDWSNLTQQYLGKCGELYAQYILEYCGYHTYTSSVDDHGIDLLAMDEDGKVYKVQVKTVTAGSYTFIRDINFPKDLIVFYFRIVNNRADAYIYHRNDFPSDDADAVSAQFSYHSFSGEGQKSDPEYGISGANKYYDGVESPYHIDGSDWVFDKEKVIRLMEQ